MKKALIMPLLALSIGLNAFIAFKKLHGNKPAAAPSDWSVIWNKQKTDLYSAVPINAGDIVFVGDSHIERFLLNDFYPGNKVRNRGIGSNTTDQVIARLPVILQRKPSKVFLLIGINDLAMGRSADSTFDNITKIIRMVNRATTTPYVISLFPSRGADGHLNDATRQVNTQLSDYCIRANIEFINVYPKLVKDGELDSALTSDDTHLNSTGYMMFKRMIDAYIDR